MRIDQIDINQLANADFSALEPPPASRPVTPTAVKDIDVAKLAQADFSALDQKKAPLPSFGESGWNNIRNQANSYLGTKYRWGGNGKSGIDCSGLVVETYKPFGIKLPRTAATQYSATRRITESELEPGDLIFLKNTGSRKGITHVGIYIGNGKWTQASSKHGVITESFDKPYNRSHLAGFGTMRHDLKKYQSKAAKDTPSLGQGSWTDAIASGNSVAQVAPPAVNTQLTTTLKAKKTPWTELIGEDKPAWETPKYKRPAPSGPTERLSAVDDSNLGQAQVIFNMMSGPGGGMNPLANTETGNLTPEQMQEAMDMGARGNLNSVLALGAAVNPPAAASIATGLGITKAGIEAEEILGRKIAGGKPNEDPEGVWQGLKADLFNALVSREIADATKAKDPARLAKAEAYLQNSPGSGSVLSGVAAGFLAEAPSFLGLKSAVGGGAKLAAAALAKKSVPTWLAKAAPVIGSTAGGAASWYQSAEGNQLVRAINESGYSLDTPEGAAAFLLDDEAVSKAAATAAKRGVPEAVMNAFGMSLGNAAIAKLGDATLGAIAGGRAASAGLQGAGGFAGAKLAGGSNEEALQAGFTQAALDIVFGAKQTIKQIRGLGTTATPDVPVALPEVTVDPVGYKFRPVPEPEVVTPEPEAPKVRVRKPKPEPVTLESIRRDLDGAMAELDAEEAAIRKQQASVLKRKGTKERKDELAPLFKQQLDVIAEARKQLKAVAAEAEAPLLEAQRLKAEQKQRDQEWYKAESEFKERKDLKARLSYIDGRLRDLRGRKPQTEAMVEEIGQLEVEQQQKTARLQELEPVTPVAPEPVIPEVVEPAPIVKGKKKIVRPAPPVKAAKAPAVPEPLPVAEPELLERVAPLAPEPVVAPPEVVAPPKPKAAVKKKVAKVVPVEPAPILRESTIEAKPVLEEKPVPKAKASPILRESPPVAELKIGSEYFDKDAGVVFRYEGDDVAKITRSRNKDEVGMIVAYRGDNADVVPATDATLKKLAPSLAKTVEAIDSPALAPEKMKAAKTSARVAIAPIEGGKARQLQDMISDLSRATGVKILQRGKVSPKAAGTYSTDTQATATRRAGDLPSVIHEVTHNLDDTHGLVKEWAGKDTSPFDDELFKPEFQHTAKPKRGKSYNRSEGVGEFFRSYVFNPEEAKRLAPKFWKHAQSILPEKALKGIDAFSKDVREWAGATPLEQGASNLKMWSKKPGIVERMRNAFRDTSDLGFETTPRDRIRAMYDDAMRPLRKGIRTAKEWRGQTNMRPSEDPEYMLGAYAHTARKLKDIVEHRPIEADGSPVKELDGGLRSLLKPFDQTSEQTLRDDMQDTVLYMISERVRDTADTRAELFDPALRNAFKQRLLLTGEGAGIYSDYDIALAILKEVKMGDPARFKRVTEGAKKYRQWSDWLLRYLRDKGRISADDYDSIRAANPYYVDWHREIDDIVTMHRRTKRGPSQLLQKMEGSSLEIENPYVGLMRQTERVIKDADRNEIISSFASLLSHSRKMHSDSPKAKPFADIGAKTNANDKSKTLFYAKGKKQHFRFEPGIKQAIDRMDYMPNGNVATAFAGFLRGTITHSPSFLARNIIRDTVNRAVITRIDNQPMFPKGEADDVVRLGLAGGLMTGHYLKDSNSWNKVLEHTIRVEAKKKNVVMLLPDMLQPVIDTMEASETMNRLAEFRRARRSVENREGWTDWDKDLFAAAEARELQDFAVAGSLVYELNRYIPFTNAAVRGLRRTYAGLKEDPARFVARWSAYVVAPTLATYMWNRSQGEKTLEEYRELPAYLRDMFWNFKVGPDTWVRVPKPFEIGVLATGVERSLDTVLDGKDAFDGFAPNVVRSMLPVDETALLGPFRPVAEVFANYDMFRDHNIVSKYEQDLNLDLREGTKNASRIGHALQELTQVDARKLDYLISSMLSGYGRAILQTSDLGKNNNQIVRWGDVATGMLATSPSSQAKSVKKVDDLTREFGIPRNKRQLKAMERARDASFEAKSLKGKDAAKRKLREAARDVLPAVKRMAAEKKKKLQ